MLGTTNIKLMESFWRT